MIHIWNILLTLYSANALIGSDQLTIKIEIYGDYLPDKSFVSNILFTHNDITKFKFYIDALKYFARSTFYYIPCKKRTKDTIW